MIVKIGGVEKEIQSQTLDIEDAINARSICSFRIFDESGTYRPNIGDTVEIYDDTELVFAGEVDEPEEWKLPGTNSLNEDINVVDWHCVADRIRVAETYENEVAGDIVRDFITKYLTAEGITAGTITDGPTISKAVFPYRSASECLDELSELTGFQWRINPDKSLDFCERSTNAAPWDITPDSEIRGVTVKRNRQKYRNRQYIQAGKDISIIQTRSFKGDGETQVWTLDMPVAKVPVVKVDGVEKTVGIRQLEQGKDFYWSKGEKEISQDPEGTKLTSSNTLTVEYQGLFPIIVVADDPEEVAARGIHEDIEQRADIDTKEAALAYADGLLRRYARIETVVSYETNEPGLKAGQLQNINLPIHDIDGDFLLSSVRISEPGRADGKLTYQVQALSGESVGGWAAFFKKLVAGKQTFTIRENEVLVKLLTFRDSFEVPTMEDEMQFTLHQYWLCGQVTCGTGVII
jgi:hypothetical protein